MSETTEKNGERVAEEFVVETHKETVTETEAEVKSVLMQSINDVVASVDECDDNKSEYESVVDEDEKRSIEAQCEQPAQLEDETRESVKVQSDECSPKESVDVLLQETLEKETDSSDVFLGEEGGEEGFAEMNEDDEYEDVESEDEAELLAEKINDVKNNDESSTLNANIEKEVEGDEDDQHYVEGERQQGDGQESGDQSGNLTDKELDDDEDRRNPQYIPKRGAFYEHDDRMVAAGEEGVKEVPPQPPVVIAKSVETTEKVVKKGKKLWSDDGKWKHDLFNEDEQKPKSREEMLSTYGYDIRNEDNAPKARRRRRYARGPNKYTRNWQDEDAYGKLKNERKSSNLTNEKEVEREKWNNEQRDRDMDRNRDGERDRDRDRDVEREMDRDRERQRDYLKHGRRTKSSFVPFKNEDFPELPLNENDKRRAERSILRDGRPSNAWIKSRSRNPEENRRPPSPEVEYKTEPMKVIEAIENNRRSSIPVDPLKVEMVRTQTFENSRYTSRRGDDSSNGKEKTLVYSNVLNNDHAEMGRPIRKTSHLQDGLKPVGYGSQKVDQSERKVKSNAKPGTKEEVFNENGRGDVRGNFHQNYLSEMNSGMQKLNLEKTNRSNDNESSQQRPKRYSSLRQQQQQRTIPDGLNPSLSANTQNVPVNHQQRQASQNQFFEGASHSPGFYTEPASPQSSFAYIQQNNPESQPQPAQHPSRFLPHQISPRYLPPSGPEPPSEPPFIAQAVPAPSTPQTTTAHPVLTAPAASFLPTYPPGYPQFPPPPPQFHPIPQPSQAEIYRGGVTYYDTTAQQGLRQFPQRRPKNAIPIVPPPQVEM